MRVCVHFSMSSDLSISWIIASAKIFLQQQRLHGVTKNITIKSIQHINKCIEFQQTGVLRNTGVPVFVTYRLRQLNTPFHTSSNGPNRRPGLASRNQSGNGRIAKQRH